MRQLLVFGEKTFKIEIPDDAKVTFGPWSPPAKRKNEYNPDNLYKPTGTLRVYRGEGQKENNILACFSDVIGFRDLALGYAEQVAKEEGATIWKDDQEGYVRENKVSIKKEWTVPQLPSPTIHRKTNK